MLKGLRKQRFPDNNKDFGINRLCDLHPHGTRTDGDLVLSVVTPLADDYALYEEARCILQSAAEGGQLIVRLDDDKTLGRELRTYLQTDRYIGRKNDGTAATTTVKILRERQEENRERRAAPGPATGAPVQGGRLLRRRPAGPAQGRHRRRGLERCPELPHPQQLQQARLPQRTCPPTPRPRSRRCSVPPTWTTWASHWRPARATSRHSPRSRATSTSWPAPTAR